MNRPIVTLRTVLSAIAVLLGSVCIVAVPELFIAWLFGGAPFGRITYIGHVLFDTHIYLQWMGALVEQWPESGPFFWLNTPLRAMGSVPGISIPEAWVASRVLAFAFLAGAFWWCARQLVQDRWKAAGWVAAGMFFPILSLSLRPGSYSWDLPFAVLAVGAAWRIYAYVEKKSWYRAAGWSVLACAAASCYPWYLLVVGLLIVGLWAPTTLRKWNLGVTALAWGVIAVTFSVICIPLASWLAQPIFTPTWDFYARAGMAWSRLPVITGVLPAAGILAAMSVFAAFLFRKEAVIQSRLAVLVTAWIALFVAWFHSVLTSFYTSNDHFRSGILLLAWFSALMVASLPSVTPSIRAARLRWIQRLLIAVSLFSALMVVRAVVQTRDGIGSDYLQQLHTAVWAATLFVTLSVRRLMGARSLLITRPSTWLIVWCVAGVFSYGYALMTEARMVRDAAPLADLIVWTRTHVPVQIPGCATPALADVLSAHAGRRIYPSESTTYLRETHEVLGERLRIIRSRRVSGGVEEETAFQTAYVGYRTASCRQFGLATSVLRALNVSEARIETLTGCAEGAVKREWQQIWQSDSRQTSDEQFRATCPVVYLSVDDAGGWVIPDDYQEAHAGAFIIRYDPATPIRLD